MCVRQRELIQDHNLWVYVVMFGEKGLNITGTFPLVLKWAFTGIFFKGKGECGSLSMTVYLTLSMLFEFCSPRVTTPSLCFNR